MGDFTLSLSIILYFHFFYFPNATYQRLRVPTSRNRTCRRFRTLIQDDRRDRSKKQTYRRDQICQVIGITAHSRLGCKDDASPRRHRFKFIFLKLSFYIILSKIPIKTSIKYLATLDYSFTQLSTLAFYSSLAFHHYVATQSPSLSASQFPTLLYITQTRHIILPKKHRFPNQAKSSNITDRPTDIAYRCH